MTAAGGEAVALPDPSLDPESAHDVELLEAVRAGSVGAFGILYETYRPHAVRYARAMIGASRPDLIDDIVEAAFVRIYQAIGRGNGPTTSFRRYLVVCVRHESWRARRGEVRAEAAVRRLHDDAHDDTRDGDEGASPPSAGVVHHTLLVDALAELPARWRNVLWLSEVEGRQPAEVAALMGLSPNTAAALAYRARVGLRRAYFNVYGTLAPTPTCRTLAPLLAESLGGSLEATDQAEVASHLASCPACRDAVRGVDPAGAAMALVGPLGALTAGRWALHAGESGERRPLGVRRRGLVAVAGALLVVIAGLALGLAGTSPGPARVPAAMGPPSSVPGTTSSTVAGTSTSVPSSSTSGVVTSIPPAPPVSVGDADAEAPSAPPSVTNPTPTTAPAPEMVGNAAGSVSATDPVLREIVPVGGVPIELIGGDNKTVVRTFTDLSGQWRAQRVRKGRYQVAAWVPVGLAPAGAAPPESSGDRWRVVLGSVTVTGGGQANLAAPLTPRRVLAASSAALPDVVASGSEFTWDVSLSSAPLATSGVRTELVVSYPAGARVSVAVPTGCRWSDPGRGRAVLSCDAGRLAPAGKHVAVPFVATGNGTLTLDLTVRARGNAVGARLTEQVVVGP